MKVARLQIVQNEGRPTPTEEYIAEYGWVAWLRQTREMLDWLSETEQGQNE